MDVIKNNPFRTLDLPASASDRLIAKTAHKLRLAVEMGTNTRVKRLSSYFIEYELTMDVIRAAENRLHRPSDRFLYSLFANTSGYGPVIDQLESSEIHNSKKFYPVFIQVDSYLNNLIAAFTPGGVKMSNLLEAVNIAGELYSSQIFNEYCEHISAGKQWMEIVYAEFGKNIVFGLENSSGSSLPLSKIMSSLSGFPEDAYRLLSNQILDSICDPIEASTKLNQSSRKQTPEQGLALGEGLIALNEKNLELLSEMDQSEWPRAILTINRLCGEIFQSSIDFYNLTIKSRQLNIEELKRSIAIELVAYKYVIDESLQDKLLESINDNQNSLKSLEENEKIRKIMDDDSALNVNLPVLSDGYSYWPVCVCCLTPTERMHKWTAEQSIGNSKRTRGISLPYCIECEKHEGEIGSKRMTVIMMILGIIGILGFLLGRGGMPVEVGAIFGLVTSVALYLIVKKNQKPKWATTLEPISSNHAHRGMPVKIIDFDYSTTTIRFMNSVYAHRFAEMNKVQTSKPIKLKKYSKGINILEGKSGIQIAAWSTIVGPIIAAICANVGLEAQGSPSLNPVIPPGYSGTVTQPPVNPPIPVYVPPAVDIPPPSNTKAYLRTAERQRIEEMQAKLLRMKNLLNSERAELDSVQEQINSSNSRLNYLRQFNDPYPYNLEIDNHNSLIAEFRSKQSNFNANVARHNRLLAEINTAIDNYNNGN